MLIQRLKTLRPGFCKIYVKKVYKYTARVFSQNAHVFFSIQSQDFLLIWWFFLSVFPRVFSQGFFDN